VTVPDGTEIVASATFDKTWRVRNNGCQPWNGVQLAFESGDAMGGPASVPVPTTAPGATADLTVRLTAPSTPGEYRGYWQLRTADGAAFGPYSLFVEIKVISADTPTPTATATTQPAPDLVVDDVYTTPSTPIIDNETTFHVVVKNKGSAAAGASKVLATFQPSGTNRTVDVPALNSGATFDAQVKITYTAPGTFAATFVVDTDGQVVESNETNNSFTDTYAHYRLVTYSTGLVTIPGTFCIDLDSGSTACDGNADFFWEQVDAVERYLRPRNGALVAVAGTTSVNYQGCIALTLSDTPLNGSNNASNQIPAGVYVCAKTSADRISQFRINTYGYDLAIGYTTWDLSGS
jgi:hypothetical protein